MKFLQNGTVKQNKQQQHRGIWVHFAHALAHANLEQDCFLTIGEILSTFYSIFVIGSSTTLRPLKSISIASPFIIISLIRNLMQSMRMTESLMANFLIPLK
jgi:hypothetical protein